MNGTWSLKNLISGTIRGDDSFSGMLIPLLNTGIALLS